MDTHDTERTPQPAPAPLAPAARRSTAWIVCGGVLVVTALGGVGALLLGAPMPWERVAEAKQPAKADLAIELVQDKPHTIVIPTEVRQSLGITKNGKDLVAEARYPTHSQELVLPGSTALDPTRLYRIRARFAPARVVEIAARLNYSVDPPVEVRDEAASQKAGRTVFQELRSGDTVKKGQLLAVFYSVEVGTKKNDLIDAISQRFLDEEILEKAEKAYRSGSLPEINMLTYQRNVEVDRNAERRAVNSLRTWDIPEEEIKACYDEAERLRKLKGRDRDLAKIDKNDQWPRVKLVAPEDGVIIERNVTQQEMVVDGTTNLFQIATVDRMIVIVNCPEETVETLLDLPRDSMRWTIKTVSADTKNGIEGTIDEIGRIIDPNQHTAVIKGHIDNPKEKLRTGQFVSAAIKLPPPEDPKLKEKGLKLPESSLSVEVPIDAVSEDGQTCVVFVQTDAKNHEYTMHRVQLTHRFETRAFVRCTPVDEDMQPKAEEQKLGAMRIEPLAKGKRILTTGVGELKAVLLDKESQPKKKDGEK